jgi:hypothetical protein
MIGDAWLVTQTRPRNPGGWSRVNHTDPESPLEASMPRVLMPGLLLEVEEDGGNLVLVWLK